MNHSRQRFLVLAACWLAAAFHSPAVSAGEAAPGSKPAMAATAPLQYTSSFSLISDICADAAAALTGFFDSSLVEVRPFIHIGGAGNNDSSLLGVVLADQMAAMLNGQANARFGVRTPEEGGGQLLEGVLQEMNGYLRIHMHATNQAGASRSHVAFVEISAPLFRALHSYVEPR